ncbi:cation-translocating P-type ATPase [Caproicibacter fermentans]|uniref:cation-translocating P-type ATPase n=1 Tax=Caproicibacter fermentans TaxID=2576756 RepID=UPI002ED5CA6B
MNDYLKDSGAVMNELGSRRDGLTPEEAERRLEERGPNRLKDAEKKSMLVRLKEQLLNPMILILLAAALISGLLGEAADASVILFVVVLNSILGIVQESKSEKAIEALQSMTASRARVRRGGEVLSVPSAELVTGDIVLLEAGDAVPADLRILESASLKIEEAALTGESVPVDKSPDALDAPEGGVPLGDRKNMAYLGGSAVYGRGTGVVTATGMETEMGKIADTLAKAKDEETPLQQRLNQLSRLLSLGVLGICAFIFAFSLFTSHNYSTQSVLNSFLLAVSLAVAAVPEGLAAVVTIVLSIGVSKMSARSAIIRKLTAVETLGCTQVICTDKTGTLTQNRMTVVDSFGDLPLLVRAFALCSDSRLNSQTGEIVGEPTENALVAFARKEGLDKNTLDSEFPRLGEAPFDSMRKMMTTLHGLPDGSVVQYTKGAPDEILKRCDSVLSDGAVVPMSEELRRKIIGSNREMANRALRVLAAAQKKLPALPDDLSPEKLESGLTFLGLAGMIDPVREEAAEAVRECRRAGIRPVMITGDHRDTAAAIAAQIGIAEPGDPVMTGSELDRLTDEELKEAVLRCGAYARVQPEHKVRIVRALKDLGLVTAMTGDGVNDAPALKTADIGVGMGITGTDVTKNAADMVLADDNFATIVYAVREGRRIYDNILKTVQFLLSSNLSEVISIFAATLLGFSLFRPIHILWINLITDSLPAVALGTERAEHGIMNRPPRGKSESLFANGLGADVLYQGATVAVLTLASYWAGSGSGPDTGTTMAFVTLSMCEIFHSFNLRSRRGSVFLLHGQNLILLGTMLLSLLLTFAMVELPFLSLAFSLISLTPRQYLISIGIALLILPVVEAVKAVQRRMSR